MENKKESLKHVHTEQHYRRQHEHVCSNCECTIAKVLITAAVNTTALQRIIAVIRECAVLALFLVVLTGRLLQAPSMFITFTALCFIYSRSLSRSVQQRCSFFQLYCYHNRPRLSPVCTHSSSRNMLLRHRDTWLTTVFRVFWSQWGTLGWYRIPQYRKKYWQIPKCRVENRRNTDTAFMIGDAYLTLNPSRVVLSQACIHQ